MESFRAALFAKLNGTPGITSLLATTTSIYHRRAPLAAAFPLILITKQTGAPMWAFAGRPLDDQLWTVRGVDRAPTSSTAEEIAKQIDLALTDPVMTLTDGSLMYCRRETDIDLEEGTDPDVMVHHCGGLYRVFIDRAVVGG